MPCALYHAAAFDTRDWILAVTDGVFECLLNQPVHTTIDFHMAAPAKNRDVLTVVVPGVSIDVMAFGRLVLTAALADRQ